jgi:hypothetical protein
MTGQDSDGGGESQRKCVRCMQGLCGDFDTRRPSNLGPCRGERFFVLSHFRPVSATSNGLWTLEYLFRSNLIIHRAHKAIQEDDCPPRRRSWLRFPWLSPIRNSFELRGLCCRSYFGPRTCDRGITNVSKLESGFPLLTPTMQAGKGSIIYRAQKAIQGDD